MSRPSNSRVNAKRGARRASTGGQATTKRTARGPKSDANSDAKSEARRAAERRREARRAGIGNARRSKAGSSHGVKTETRGPRAPLRPATRRMLKLGAKLGLVVGVAYGVLFAAQEAYDYATTSPRFELRSLIYQPTAHIDDAQMRKLLGLERGTNILAVEPEELAMRVAEHPWVGSAIVERHFPDTLEVRVTERVAEATVLAGSLYLVDGEGRIFKRAEGREREGLPIITGVARDSIAAAGEAGSPELRRALDAIEVYQAKRRPALGEVHLEPEGALSLYTAERGTRLRLGRTPVTKALARYDALRAALGSRADKLELVHLDGEIRPGERERVVARFVDERTERQVIAEGQLARAEDHPRASDDANASLEQAADAEPELQGYERRIPRYE